jgi:hypothetical protein
LDCENYPPLKFVQHLHDCAGIVDVGVDFVNCAVVDVVVTIDIVLLNFHGAPKRVTTIVVFVIANSDADDDPAYCHCCHTVVVMCRCVDFVGRPRNELATANHCLTVSLDVLELWLVNMLLSYFCADERTKFIDQIL